MGDILKYKVKNRTIVLNNIFLGIIGDLGEVKVIWYLVNFRSKEGLYINLFVSSFLDKIKSSSFTTPFNFST